MDVWIFCLTLAGLNLSASFDAMVHEELRFIYTCICFSTVLCLLYKTVLGYTFLFHSILLLIVFVSLNNFH